MHRKEGLSPSAAARRGGSSAPAALPHPPMRGSPPSPPGVRDLHQVGWRDLEALQSAHRDARLHLRLELDEGNPRLARHQPHLLEAGELREEHREHHLVDLVWQVLHEQDRVRQLAAGAAGAAGENAASTAAAKQTPTKRRSTRSASAKEGSGKRDSGGKRSRRGE
eukprot:CAMPEP_0196681852 /NCGR_PEP_ID=MMETSP1090-20130531/8804_1 /TAXON_ID=37098 /ORGANISM="Isochrysis sp, Strain CCMP1244" /LENGTH=165 /DNA_ID=CAMNT_0042020241 /DNA_START=73 /DNA_END=571 /DNA_ORIENTATION=-